MIPIPGLSERNPLPINVGADKYDPYDLKMKRSQVLRIFENPWPHCEKCEVYFYPSMGTEYKYYCPKCQRTQEK